MCTVLLVKQFLLTCVQIILVNFNKRCSVLISYLYINNFIITVVSKAHTWISCCDNETSYLCFIVDYLLNMCYYWKNFVFFARSGGYIYIYIHI